MNIMTRSELKKMQEDREDILLLNVLSQESFRRAHIPGSCNAPIGEEDFLQKVAGMAGEEGKNRRIMTYCGGFHCNASKQAAHRLEAAGYTRISAFEGGMEDWIDAGYPVAGDASESCKEECSG